MKRYFLFCLLFCSLIPVPLCVSAVPAQTVHQAKPLLIRILEKIHLLKVAVSKELHKKDNLQDDLKTSEEDIGHLSHQMFLTRQTLKHKNQILSHIKAKERENQAKLHHEKHALQRQIISIYRLGSQPFVKILLNKEDPDEINRDLQYYQYLNRARQKNIQEIQSLIDKSKGLEHRIEEEKYSLIKTEAQLNQQHQELRQKQLHRRKLLNHINRNIVGKQRQLDQLNTDKKRLQKVIKKLSASYYQNLSGEKFYLMKHRLFWPVKGHIIEHFGEALLGGDLHATGILIRADAGQDVHAVFSGKVVFAKWLNGFGLLIIIQHSRDYMTLYGHNQSIYVKEGERIHSGQIIAAAGNSGGFNQNGLYFEIRYKGRPRNPLIWLK